MPDALLSSAVVLRARAKELGMEQDAVDKAVSEGIGTMGGFGFSTEFCPGFPKSHQGLQQDKA